MGLDAEDYVEIAKSMKAQGVDLIDVSTGAVAAARIPHSRNIKSSLLK